MAESAVGRKGDESPTTHLDCTLEDSAMSTSGYAQVVFHNVQERYTPGSPVFNFHSCKLFLERIL